ncbi:hypothetical protein TWF281_002461 [Arthrobotrys megalospora]
MRTILVALLGVQLAAGAALNIQERAACNADNCLRNLRDKRYSSSASLFCSKWLQSTITQTFYDVSTTYTTATSTPEVATITDDVTITELTTTGTVTIYPTVTDDPRYAKRGEIGYPKWLSGTYPATRVSSACSCFIVSPSPVVHVSVTLTTSTATIVNTVTLPTITTFTTLTVTEAQPVAATTNVNVPIHCGIHGCPTIPSRGPFSQMYPFHGSWKDCRDVCRGNDLCVAFSYAAFGGGPTRSCQLLVQDASQSYWAELGLTNFCDEFRLYDRGCDTELH